MEQITKDKMIEMADAGKNYTEIAFACGLARSTVAHMLPKLGHPCAAKRGRPGKKYAPPAMKTSTAAPIVYSRLTPEEIRDQYGAPGERREKPRAMWPEAMMG